MRWKSKRNCSRLIKVLNVLGAGSVRIQPGLANNNGKQTRSCEKIYIGEGGTVKREPLLFIFSVYITTMLARSEKNVSATTKKIVYVYARNWHSLCLLTLMKFNDYIS